MDVLVKMCDCPEVQEAAPFAAGVRVWFRETGETEVYGEEDVLAWTKIELGDEGCLILPRQEDIQEIILKRWGNDHPHKLLSAFSNWCISDETTRGTDFSIVEYWLMFFMHEVHNKRWTAEGWG